MRKLFTCWSIYICTFSSSYFYFSLKKFGMLTDWLLLDRCFDFIKCTRSWRLIRSTEKLTRRKKFLFWSWKTFISSFLLLHLNFFSFLAKWQMPLSFLAIWQVFLSRFFAEYISVSDLGSKAMHYFTLSRKGIMEIKRKLGKPPFNKTRGGGGEEWS